MNYEDLVQHTHKMATFNGRVLPGAYGSHALQFNRWVGRGKLLRLKRGLYTLPESRRQAKFSLPWLANTLYSPSYLSLDFVLARFDLIPERVSCLSSISLLKTAAIKNPLGSFSYRHVKQDLFFGFEEVLDEYDTRVLMATPEKALLDLLYLRAQWEPSRDFFENNLRLQQLDQLRVGRLKTYARPYQLKKISSAVQILLKMR